MRILHKGGPAARGLLLRVAEEEVSMEGEEMVARLPVEAAVGSERLVAMLRIQEAAVAVVELQELGLLKTGWEEMDRLSVWQGMMEEVCNRLLFPEELLAMAGL
jgi:hypothetical protein